VLIYQEPLYSSGVFGKERCQNTGSILAAQISGRAISPDEKPLIDKVFARWIPSYWKTVSVDVSNAGW
jgi:hypothetical protein